VRTFDAELDLPDKLPADALVFVEAYRGSPAARMRFPWGTVGHPVAPQNRRLSDFAGDERTPLFRVKVTDASGQPGRLLADGSQIRPIDPDEKPDTKRGILYTVWGDNEGLVWRLDLTNYHEGPCLVIDTTADPDRQLPITKPFRALVYPEIVRRVLSSLLLDEDHGGEGALNDDTLHWPKQWLHFPREGFGYAETPPGLEDTEDTKQDWIDNAVKHCAKSAGFCKLIAPPEDQEVDHV
jgi:hypothetical protein